MELELELVKYHQINKENKTIIDDKLIKLINDNSISSHNKNKVLVHIFYLFCKCHYYKDAINSIIKK